MKKLISLALVTTISLIMVGCASISKEEDLQQLNGSQLSELLPGKTYTRKTDYGRWASYYKDGANGIGKAWGGWGEENVTQKYTITQDGEMCTTYMGEYDWAKPGNKFCDLFYMDQSGMYYRKVTEDTWKPQRIGTFIKIEIIEGDKYELANLLGCVNRNEISANPPEELIQQVRALLPLAEEYVFSNEKEALENGIALNSYQLVIANKIGLKNPEKVRIYYVDQLPFPSDPTLAELAIKTGYGTPKKAYTFGYGVWILSSAKGDRVVVAHEFVHIRQAEEMGLSEQIKQYLMQLFIYGYDKAPMEIEAYSEEKKYI